MELAFLPVHLVHVGFEIINVGTSGQVEALFQYFQQDWLPPVKFRRGTFMVCLCGPTTIWKGKTVTVVRKIDDGYKHGRAPYDEEQLTESSSDG
ncbi:hypothetical protein T03_4236 [Trichinella britovi]|uniref:Uncharacterized protein n=1 Tax=Trichinella britovi TaxID=45882 RepID=A0A0V1CJ80_TRIBR|nr:hypothetical protein T03_4236 [Trichinella britovi]